MIDPSDERSPRIIQMGRAVGVQLVIKARNVLCLGKKEN